MRRLFAQGFASDDERNLRAIGTAVMQSLCLENWPKCGQRASWDSESKNLQQGNPSHLFPQVFPGLFHASCIQACIVHFFEFKVRFPRHTLRHITCPSVPSFVHGWGIVVNSESGKTSSGALRKGLWHRSLSCKLSCDICINQCTPESGRDEV